MPRRGDVRVGTSGWIYKHWRGLFYPEGLPAARWFAAYAARFDTVEVNNTFYRLPSAEAFDAWRAQAPPGFVYSVKASRFLTHRKKLKDPEEPLDRLLGLARRLGPHLGPVLYQLPPRWGCDPDRLRAFLAALPAGVRHVLEFRDPSWYSAEVRELLSEAGVSFCIHDMRDCPSPLWVTGPLVYLRFHGPEPQRYAGRYGPGKLGTWAERIRGFRCQGRDVFVYFNNDVGGHAPADAAMLKELTGVS